MYPVSNKFLAEVTARFNYPINIIEVVSGTAQHSLPIIDGDVTLDSTSDVERTFRATVPFSDTNYSILTDPNAEIRVYRGFKFLDGTSEVVPLGTFMLDSDVTSDEDDCTISFTASDLSRRISRNKITAPIVIKKGTNLKTAITQMAQTAYSFVRLSLSDVDVVTKSQIVCEKGDSQDVWKSMQELAKANGLDIMFNGIGYLTWRTSSSSPVWTFGGSAAPSLLSREKKAALGDTYNGVVVTSTSTDSEDVIQGVAWDEDPNSPTYYLGTYGKAPIYIESSNVTTVKQAIEYAQSELKKYLGRSESMSWTQLINPALEPGDIVTFYDQGKQYVIDKLSIPLGNSATGMSAESRSIRIGAPE